MEGGQQEKSNIILSVVTMCYSFVPLICLCDSLGIACVLCDEACYVISYPFPFA